MVGSFVRFFFTRCEESLNSLVRCAHSFVRASRNSWRKIVRTHQPWSNLYICAHAFMMIWPLIKDLKDDRVHAGIGGNFCHSHHKPVTFTDCKCVTKVFQIIFSTTWHLAHKRSKKRKWDFRGNVEIHDPNFPKSGPKNLIKPRSAVVIGSADPLKFRSESRIRAKILTKSADP